LRYFFNTLFLLAIAFVICACNKTSHQVEYGYESEAITLDIKANEDLHWYNHTSHPLTVCVYQLEDLKLFTKLAEDPEGLDKLIGYHCKKFSDALTFTRLVIRPRDEFEQTIDRVEDAEVVVIAAAYNISTKDRTTKWTKIPVVPEKKWFIKVKDIPGHLYIKITFGRDRILTFERK